MNMPVESTKTSTVLSIIVMLQAVNPDVVVEDHWETDRNATGLRLPTGELLYIGTFNGFYWSLEGPDDSFEDGEMKSYDGFCVILKRLVKAQDS